MLQDRPLTDVTALQQSLRRSEEHFRLFVEQVVDYALFMLDERGIVVSWNRGAERLKGYAAHEIIGQHFSRFYTEEDRLAGKPEQMLERAGRKGHVEDEGWRVRKDGSRFWADVVITAVHDEAGRSIGFAKVTRDLTERQVAEEALRDSEAELSAFFDMSLDLMAVALPLEGHFSRVNASCTHVLGWTAEELTSRPWLDYVHPDDRAATALAAQALVEGRDLLTFTNRYRAKDGGYHWLEWRVAAGSDRTHAYAVARDVTDQVHSKQALEQVHRDLTTTNARLEVREAAAVKRAEASEIQFRELIDNLPELAWTARADGFIDFYNHRWFEYTGTTPDEMRGWGWRNVHAPEMLPEVERRWQLALTHGEPFEMEYPLRRADGRFRWFLTRVRPLRDANGRIERWFGVNTDITERRQTEEALRASRERYRATFEQAGVGIAEVSLDGGWLQVNERLAQIVGYSREELLPRTFQAITHPDDLGTDLQLLSELLTGARASYTMEKRYLCKDGSTVWVLLTVALVRRSDGSPDYFISVVEDIDELHSLRETLEQRVRERTAELAAANRELESFSYSVSHDLRSPLRAVAGFAKALRDEPLDDDARRYLARIEAAAKRMGGLIDDLLGLARIGRGPIERADVNLSAVIEAIRSTLELGATRRVRWEIQPEVHARGDAGLLGIALDNLVRNAWKFSREKDEAVIGFRALDREGERIYAVTDNGAGFDLDHARNLFAPFQRMHASTRFEGSGIGLATVQRIVRRHGGRIWAEASPDQGATFFFTLGTEERGGES